MAKVTLQHIAERVGVSRMTVSNAFSRPDQLSAELRGRILAVAAELGYLGPDPSARSLATGQTGTIGVLWASRLRDALADEVSARFLGAVADELSPAGLALALIPADTTGPVVAARDVAMDGAIAFSCDPELPALDLLRRRAIPLVFVDMPAFDHAPTVTIDDRGGARAAAQHLLDLGHRRIAIVTTGFGPEPGRAQFPLSPSGARLRVLAERMAGWLEALRPAGVEPLLINEPDGYGATTVTDLPLTGDDRPTAVLCLTDVMAQAVYAAASDAGLDVGADLSVIGFDDHPLALRVRPTLTTVRQDTAAKGRAAARALLAAIGHTPVAAGLPPQLHLPVELVVRDSTAPAR